MLSSGACSTFSLRSPHTDHHHSVGEYWLEDATSPVKLSKADQDLIKRIFDEEKIVYHPDTMFQDTDQLAKALLEGFGSRAHEYASADNLAYTMMEINLNRFGYNKNIAEITELNNAFQQSKDFNKFKGAAKEILGTYKVNHLRTEYNLAVATGQNASRYINQLREADIFPYLQYQTAGDDKVREEHAALDGKVFSINDPELAAIYPPNGFGCRCEMVQIDSDEGAALGITSPQEGRGLLGEEWDNMVKYGFDRNLAEAGEIFDLNKVYASQLEEAVVKPLYDLTFNDINLPMSNAIQSLVKHGKMKLDDLSQDTLLKTFDEKVVKVGDRKFNVYEDYAGRPVGLSRETLVGQTSGSFLSPGEMRNAIFTNMDELMKSPDEVWLIPQAGNAYKQVYIRYYKDDVMMASTLVDREEGRRIASWSRMHQEVPNRKGLLIYKSYGSK